jgi:pyruvate dehydrogenase E2 component (dihydrolipoamide acetyltransferase)
MTEGNLAKWLKKEGDEVHSGDVLAEIETDKATMEFEAVDDGRVGKILVPEGAQGVKVNQPIALLLGEDEDASALGKFAGSAPKSAPTAPGQDERTQPTAADPAPAAQPSIGRDRGGNGRVFASPLARRMAQQAGLDLGTINGSGPQGRIVKADIEVALSAARATPAPAQARLAAAPQPPPAPSPALSKERVLALAGNPPYTERPLTAMRRVIAKRLTESKQTVPHFYLTIDCEIDELLKIRTELNAKSDAYRISVNDFVIRATALALRQIPAANASWSDDAILLWDTVDIAVSVALDDGLITPIVKAADRKGLAACQRNQGPCRARRAAIELEEFRAGPSISTSACSGSRLRRGHQPAAWRASPLGAGEQRPVVKNGALQSRR